MVVTVYPDNPNLLEIQKAVSILKGGGIIIFPTDTVYAIGCDMYNFKAMEKLCRALSLKPEKANLSLICYDLSNISHFTQQFDTPVFKLMKRSLPGPFTFILKANNEIPKIFHSNKKTIGIRVPDNSIARLLVKELGNPLVSKSVHSEDEVLDYITDPHEIVEYWEDKVDLIIDGGFGDNNPSTIIDCSGYEPVLLREGKGEISL